MKPRTPDSAEAVNAKIAELCGWTRLIFVRHEKQSDGITTKPISGCIWQLKGQPETAKSECPNYSTSLDAMHEAEKTLTELEWPKYVTTLNALIGFTHDNEVWTCHATATERAAAFLTTKTRTNL